MCQEILHHFLVSTFAVNFLAQDPDKLPSFVWNASISAKMVSCFFCSQKIVNEKVISLGASVHFLGSGYGWFHFG